MIFVTNAYPETANLHVIISHRYEAIRYHSLTDALKSGKANLCDLLPSPCTKV